MTSLNSFGSRATLDVAGKPYTIYRLDALVEAVAAAQSDRLPVQPQDPPRESAAKRGRRLREAADIETLANWDVKAQASRRRSPSAPAACCCRTSPACPPSSISPRCATRSPALGGDPQRINPLQPVDLVIDHSVQVDEYGTDAAFLINTELEFERNSERYVFLRWGQDAFKNFRVVPPGTGICHQVNLEYLGKTVFVNEDDEATRTPTRSSAPTRTRR